MESNYLKGFLSSIASALTLTSPPLYRYPYRNTAEAFRGDWKNIGKDIEAAQQNFDGTRDGEESYE
jgi:hypothetical protein